METLLSLVKTQHNIPLGAGVLDPFIKCWGFMGLWPNGKVKKNSSCLQKTYPIFAIFIALFEAIVICGVDLVLNLDDSAIINEELSYILFYTMACVKPAVIYYQQRRLQQIIFKLEKLGKLNSIDNYEETLLLKIERFRDLLVINGGKIVLGIGATLVTIGVSTALIRGKSTLRGWYPFNSEVAPYFQMKVIFRTTVLALNCFTTYMCDVCLVILLAETWAHFRILRHRVESVHEYAARKVHEEMQLERINRNTRAALGRRVIIRHCQGVAQESVSTEHDRRHLGSLHQVKMSRRPLQRNRHRSGGSKENRHVPKPSQKQQDEAVLKLRTDQEMKRVLGFCVKRHQRLLSLVRDLETFLNPCLVYQLLGCVFFTGAVGVSVLSASKMNVKDVNMLILLAGSYVEIFLFCSLSNDITLESSGVQESAYSCYWLEASDSFKRSLRIMISRSNCPCVITVAGFVPLNMNTFTTVFRKAYDFFMIFLKTADTKRTQY